MPKIRVLIVDDSVVVRRLVADVLGSDPSCEVVGTAANGKIALAKIGQVNPDVVTLDVEMPEIYDRKRYRTYRRTETIDPKSHSGLCSIAHKQPN